MRKMAFLHDTCLIRNINKYSTSLYHVYVKKTFSDLYLNWTSLTAMMREEEIANFKVILTKNQYPFKVIEQTINKLIEKHNIQKIAKYAVVKTPEKRYQKLHNVSRKCQDFAFRLKCHVETFFQQVQFNVAFRTHLPITLHIAYMVSCFISKTM